MPLQPKLHLEYARGETITICYDESIKNYAVTGIDGDRIHEELEKVEAKGNALAGDEQDPAHYLSVEIEQFIHNRRNPIGEVRLFFRNEWVWKDAVIWIEPIIVT